MAKPHNMGGGASANGARQTSKPSLKEQAAAHRASKGSYQERFKRVKSKVYDRHAKSQARLDDLGPSVQAGTQERKSWNKGKHDFTYKPPTQKAKKTAEKALPAFKKAEKRNIGDSRRLNKISEFARRNGL